MNQLDKNIKEKLANRTFVPSASAWERLEVQLNNKPQQKKKKGWLFFGGIAASIAILFSVAIAFLSTSDKNFKPQEIMVDTKIDTLIIKENTNKIFKELIVEEAIVNTEVIKEKNNVDSKQSALPVLEEKVVNETSLKNIAETKSSTNNDLKQIADVEIDKTKFETTSKEKQPEKGIKNNKNNTIKINSDDLLYAVTHSQNEVETYYAKHQITREDVLKTIKSELKKSEINMNPETILAEVERSIGDEDFQNNFMKSLKKKVTDIATAFASRNN